MLALGDRRIRGAHHDWLHRNQGLSTTDNAQKLASPALTVAARSGAHAGTRWDTVWCYAITPARTSRSGIKHEKARIHARTRLGRGSHPTLHDKQCAKRHGFTLTGQQLNETLDLLTERTKRECPFGTLSRG
jgi:hypothetical protein